MANVNRKVQYKRRNETVEEIEFSEIPPQDITGSTVCSTFFSAKVEENMPLLPIEENTDIETTFVCCEHTEHRHHAASTYETYDEESIDQTYVKSPLLGSELIGSLLQFNSEDNCDKKFNLPPGKKYHLFVSHSSNDTNDVYKMCAELEERFYLKCSNFERDFIGGETMDKNIKHEMSKSVKVLLCLSPSYLESDWCMGEAHEAMEMSSKTKIISVIPIMLQSLDTEFPTILKRYRYIDCEKENDVAAKIRDAFYHSGAVVKNDDEDTAKRNQNGFRILSKPVTKLSPFLRKGFVYKSSQLSDDDLLNLSSQNVNLMPCTQQIKAVIAYVNSQALMKYYRVFIGGKFTMIASTLLSMIVFVLSLGFESLNIIIKKSTEEYPVVILIAMFGVAGFIWLLSFLSILGVRRCLIRNLRRQIWTINRKYFEESKCLVVFDNSVMDAPFLSLIRYDTSKCKDEILNLMEKSGRYLNYDKEKLVMLADWYLKGQLCHMQENEFLSKWTLIENADYNRHNTWLCKKCICQILENGLITPKVIITI